MSPFQQTPRQRVANEPFLRLAKPTAISPISAAAACRSGLLLLHLLLFHLLARRPGRTLRIDRRNRQGRIHPGAVRCTRVKTGRLVRLLETDSTTAATRRGNLLCARFSAIDRLHGGLWNCRTIVGRGCRLWHRLSVRLSALEFLPLPLRERAGGGGYGGFLAHSAQVDSPSPLPADSPSSAPNCAAELCSPRPIGIAGRPAGISTKSPFSKARPAASCCLGWRRDSTASAVWHSCSPRPIVLARHSSWPKCWRCCSIAASWSIRGTRLTTTHRRPRSPRSVPMPISALAKLRETEITICGSSQLAHAIVSSLTQQGFATPRRSEIQTMPALGSKSSLAIVVETDHTTAQLEAFNRRAIDAQQTWMLVGVWNRRVLVGPIFLPGETACYLCFRRRLDSHRRHLAASRALEAWRHSLASPPEKCDFAEPVLPAIASLAASWTALESFSLVTGTRPVRTLGRVLVYQPDTPNWIQNGSCDCPGAMPARPTAPPTNSKPEP